MRTNGHQRLLAACCFQHSHQRNPAVALEVLVFLSSGVASAGYRLAADTMVDAEDVSVANVSQVEFNLHNFSGFRRQRRGGVVGAAGAPGFCRGLSGVASGTHSLSASG